MCRFIRLIREAEARHIMASVGAVLLIHGGNRIASAYRASEMVAEEDSTFIYETIRKGAGRSGKVKSLVRPENSCGNCIYLRVFGKAEGCAA